MREVVVDNLPRKKSRIDWIKSLGYSCKFIYDEVEGEILILSYDKSNQTLLLKYKMNEKEMKTSHFLECRIGVLIGKIKTDYKFFVGERIKEEKRDFTILSCIKILDKNNHSHRGYICKCNLCGWEEWKITESNLSKGHTCPCCNNIIVVSGINSIKDTHPDMSKYFKFYEDCITNTAYTNKKVITKCPVCGYEKPMFINNIRKRGYKCPICGKGNSFPNKFILYLLNNLSINITTEYSPYWAKNKRYDFYFKYNSEDYIIEVNGKQHYEKGFETCGGKTLEEEQENDKYKYELAISNGVKPENYIVIDFRETTLEWGKEHVLNSKLSELFDLSNINWEECLYFSLENDFVKVIELRANSDNVMTTKEISEITGISVGTVCKYLNLGNQLKLCEYNGKDSWIVNIENNRHRQESKTIMVYKDNIFLGEFDSAYYLQEHGEELFGETFNHNGIRAVCNGNRKQYKGYIFKYKGE